MIKTVDEGDLIKATHTCRKTYYDGNRVGDGPCD